LAGHLGENAVLKVLERREIENYLALSRPLAEFIKLKRELGGVPGGLPSQKDVEEALQDCADSLKEIAFERRILKWACFPYYVNREVLLEKGVEPFDVRLRGELESVRNKLAADLEKLSTVITDSRTAFDLRWATEKLSLVPGDLLLDEVSKKFGVRFIKEKDSARLAALVTREEVPKEIGNLIEEIRDRKLKA
jgi:hypothetical protein